METRHLRGESSNWSNGSTFSKNLTNLKAGHLQGERLAGNYWSLSLHFLLKAAIFYAFPCILASKTLTNIFAWWFNESPFSSADFFILKSLRPFAPVRNIKLHEKADNCSQKATSSRDSIRPAFLGPFLGMILQVLDFKSISKIH